MEEGTAIWLLGLAHAECEALRNEIDEARETCRQRYESEMALKRERDALRAELDALKAAPAQTGWIRVGDWAWANPDGRIVRFDGDFWGAEDATRFYRGSTAIEAAAARGWHDFPGLTDHSAGDP